LKSQDCTIPALEIRNPEVLDLRSSLKAGP
jgi:hypothetical protein